VAAALRQEVAADRPERVSFLTPEEFAARPELIRTRTNLLPPSLEVVRVIDIEGLDRQADGGTHVARTGEVGEVHVVGHQSKGKATSACGSPWTRPRRPSRAASRRLGGSPGAQACCAATASRSLRPSTTWQPYLRAIRSTCSSRSGVE
jgi:Threonyl and Alanyl tRNA synthetase second additional domain